MYEIYFKATMVYSDFKIINNSFLKEFVVNKTPRDQFKAHLNESCLGRIGLLRNEISKYSKTYFYDSGNGRPYPVFLHSVL